MENGRAGRTTLAPRFASSLTAGGYLCTKVLPLCPKSFPFLTADCDGKKVWSKYSQPKGAGWNCTYDSKAKCFKLNLSSVKEYALGGKLTGRVMDKNGNVTKIEVGMVTISQQSTVTLDNLVIRGNISVAAGKMVTLFSSPL